MIPVVTGAKAALYARVSKPEDQTPDNQLIALRDYAQRRGLEVVKEYVDEISATRDVRPNLEQLKRDARANRFAIVLAVRIDRIGRSLIDLETTFQEWDRYNVGFITTEQDGIDTTTPSGRLIRQVLGAVAQFERELISERTKAGLRRARAEGKRLGRPPKKRGGPGVYKAAISAGGASKTDVFHIKETGAGGKWK